MTVTRLTGYDAIAFAEEQHLKLYRYDSPIESAHKRLTIAQAGRVAAENPSLIYLDVAGRYVVYPLADEDSRGLNLHRPVAVFVMVDIARDMRTTCRAKARVALEFSTP